MKISCSKQALMNGINIVSKAVSTKSTIANLQCILIESSLSEIRLIANDIELGIETIIEGTIIEAGKIALDAKLLSDYIRKLPDSEVTIETNANNVANIRCERSKFNIHGTSGDDFNYLPEVEKNRYILLSVHREENIDIETNFMALMNAVNAMAETYDMPILYSCHPRSRKMIEKRNFVFDNRVIQHQPLGFFDYNKLQQNAFCVVSDSGTIPEEASYFKFPAVSVRTSTERPEAMEKGVFVVGSITKEQVLQAVDLAVSMNENEDKGLTVPAYADENVSTKVVKIIQSYVGIINKMVWRKF